MLIDTRPITKAIAFLFMVAISAGLMAAPQSSGPSPEDLKDGFKPLFDGKTLTGWIVEPAKRTDEWVIKDGEISSKGHGGRDATRLVSKQVYGDFILRLEFWADTAETNSGFYLRAPATGIIGSRNAYEVNIDDLHPKWPTGSVNRVFKAKGTPHTAGKWNTYDITLQGDHIIVVLNGQTTTDVHASGPAPEWVVEGTDGKYGRQGVIS